MIKFFRHLRQAMIKENRATKYLLYAFGEIVLVVIGILLALQINNWNSERITQKNIRNYYERIQVELKSELVTMHRFSKKLDFLVRENRRTLTILDSKDRDSIPAMYESLGALGTAWTADLEFPITQEFLNQGYLSKIDNDSIKMGLKNLTGMLQDQKQMAQYTLTQYNNTIEPFINSNINYSDIALDRYQRFIIKGGPPTDIDALFDDLELWNIVTFKLEGLSLDKKWVEDYVKEVEWLDRQLSEELENGKKE